MRLLFVSHLFPNSVKFTKGIFFLEKCKALVDVGVEVKVVVPVPYVPRFLSFLKPSWASYSAIESYAEVEGLEIFYKRYLLLPGKWFLNYEGLFMYWGIKNFLKKLKVEFDYQVVLGGMLTNDGRAAWEIGKSDNIPSLSFAIGSDINVYPKISSSLYSLSVDILNGIDAVISVGGEFSKVIVDAFPHLNKSVIWNSIGIDLDKFSPALSKEKSFFNDRYSVRNDEVVFLYVGRLQEMKGVKILMNSLVLMKDTPFKLFMVGDGDLASWVDDFVYENDLAGKCVRVGDVDHDSLPALYRGADIFVLPSFAEGSPTVLIEAAASGLPIVASDIAPNKDILRNNINGFEFKVGDSKDLAEKLSLLIADNDLRDSFAKRSRLVAEKEYGRIEKAEELKSVVLSLLCRGD